MSTETIHAAVIAAAARAVRQVDALVIAAGAGMGVDSGLPDFRGPEGFWRAYPHLNAAGKDFYAMASPQSFEDDAALAWQFYGHRQALYRDTPPHEGFSMLLAWARAASAGYFVFTSNVDGHFETAGFDPERIFECHGNIHRLQCLRPCGEHLWETGVPVDADAGLPACPECGGDARPNVLMFGDFGWIGDVSQEQSRRYTEWLESLRGKRLTVIEIGAGVAVPSVRHESESLLRDFGATLVRVNPREPEGPPGTVSIRSGGLDAARRIANRLAA